MHCLASRLLMALMVLGLSAVGVEDVQAGTSADRAEGRIRVRTSGSQGWREGTLLSVSEDTLRVQAQNDAIVAFPADSIESVEKYEGTRRHVDQGIFWGAVLGAGAGLAAFWVIVV